jgi:hypothetical protein
VYYIYCRSDAFTIDTYVIVGVDDTRHTEAESLVRSIVESGKDSFVPGNKIVTFRKGAIKRALVEQFPNTQSVQVYPSSIHTLKIVVTPYTPLYRISDMLALTKNGVIYTEIHPVDSYPLFMVASSSLTPITQDGVTTSRIEGVDQVFLEKLSSLIKKIESVLFPIRRIEIDSYNDIYLLSEEGIGIKITKDADMDKVWSTIVSAIDTDPLKTKLQNSLQSLEYLDIRFPNKVFYKFKDESFTNTKGGAIIPPHDATTTPQ